jgi:hypothetical protein
LDRALGLKTRLSYEPYRVTQVDDGWRVEGTFHGDRDMMGGAPIVTLSKCGKITAVLLGV